MSDITLLDYFAAHAPAAPDGSGEFKTTKQDN